MKDEEKPLDLKYRTQQFALSMVRFYVQLPKTSEAQISGKQVLRSGLQLASKIAKRGEQNRMRTSSAKWKMPCKKRMKQAIGSSFCETLK